MPVAMKQSVLFLVILVFYPLLFLLTIYGADYLPISGHDPSGGHKVDQALMAVFWAFVVTVIFMIFCHVWARRWAIHAGWAWLANGLSIIMAFIVLNGLGFYL